ncbi:MAG: hypothetical protein KDD40_09160 [Bdellovibrionales bacterium]|nr:hypothetical protein [Bdellovibrionales bacterium]
MEYLKANLWEIKNSSSLRFLGVILSLSHATILYSWFSKSTLLSGEAAVCWNFLPNCNELVFANTANIKVLFFSYAIFTAISLLCFFSFRVLALGSLTLLFSVLINILFITYDSSLNNNLNSLVIFLNIFFLLIPQKLRISKRIIVSSYFVWGLLKINNEWLAGYWLSKNLDFYLPPKGIEWIAAISIFAEIIAPLFLLSKHSQRFYTGIGLLLVYNIFKGYITGLETAIVHILIIFYFVVSHFEEEKEAREAIYRSYIRPEPSKMWVVITTIIFWMFQILPQGHLFGISKKEWPLQYLKNPIPIECKYHTLINYKHGSTHHSSQILDTHIDKMKCNSMIYFNHAKQLCKENNRDPEFVGVSAYFLRRVVSQKDFTRIFESENICEQTSNDFLGGL